MKFQKPVYLICLFSVLLGNGYDLIRWAFAAASAYPLLLLGGFTKFALLAIGLARFSNLSFGRSSLDGPHGVLRTISFLVMALACILGAAHGFVFMLVGSPLSMAVSSSNPLGMALTIAITSDIGVLGVLGFEASRIKDW